MCVDQADIQGSIFEHIETKAICRNKKRVFKGSATFDDIEMEKGGAV